MENKPIAEQMEKLKACKTVEEAKVLAKEENMDLTDEQLEAVAGGVALVASNNLTPCEKCRNESRCSAARKRAQKSAGYCSDFGRK